MDKQIGQLAALAALLGVMAGCRAPLPAKGSSEPDLQALVSRLGAEVQTASPGTELAIAVRQLGAGAPAGWNEQVPHVSASAAKVLWVAAALDRVGLGPVEPLAGPVFRASDNEASGAVIDLIGPNAVNEYLRRLGLKHTALTKWNYGKPRRATNSPDEMKGDNYFTAGDAVSFLERLDRGELLGAKETAALRSWMLLTPRAGCGGWLGSLLPEAARGSMMHKAGWLPPGCCSDDRVYNTLTEIGLVEAPGHRRYAVAILARRGNDYWGRQAPFVERASCLVYRAVAQDEAISCEVQLPKPGPHPTDCD